MWYWATNTATVTHRIGLLTQQQSHVGLRYLASNTRDWATHTATVICGIGLLTQQ